VLLQDGNSHQFADLISSYAEAFEEFRLVWHSPEFDAVRHSPVAPDYCGYTFLHSSSEACLSVSEVNSEWAKCLQQSRSELHSEASARPA
jgi:hypothetical protein